MTFVLPKSRFAVSGSGADTSFKLRVHMDERTHFKSEEGGKEGQIQMLGLAKKTKNLLPRRNETENQTAIELGYMRPSHIKESKDVSSGSLCATFSGIGSF